MEVVKEGYYQGGGQVGFEAKLRFGYRIGSRVDNDKSKDETDPDVAKKLSLWKRFRRNNKLEKKDPLSSLRKIGSVRSSSSTTSASSEASRIPSVPDWNIRNAIPKERDVNSPRVFQVKCPIGLERGNIVDIRSPSGIMPVFSARVPTGKQGGDVFVVEAPTEEQLVQAEDGEMIVAGELCGFRPVCMTKKETNQAFDWDLSSTLDRWLTPKPEVVGQPVQAKREGWV